MARRARRWSQDLALLAGGLVLAAAPLSQADEIQLRGGGRISGVVVEKTDRTITIETGPGRVTLPLSLVETVVDSRSVIEVWQERSRALSDGDVQGWAALARWAEAQSLVTQARAAWQHVLSSEPQNTEANAALDRVLLDGTWRTREDANRAQGLVPFDGRWVSRAEHDALLEQQAAESAAARSQREAEVRLREAEARVREAEANAREAEAAATQAADDGGLPVYGAYGCGGYGCNGYGDGGHGHEYGRGGQRQRRDGGDHHNDRPEAAPAPAATPQPSAIGPTKPVSPARPRPVPADSKPRGSKVR